MTEFAADELETIDIIEFGEFILSIIHDYMNNNLQIISNPKYEGIIHSAVFEIITNCYNSTLVEDLSELISENITTYFQTVGIIRSYPTSIIIAPPDLEKLTMKTYLSSKCSTTCTKRRCLVFISDGIILPLVRFGNPLKISQCKQNELIRNKCEPINLAKKKAE